jgi:hypothetical protein
LFDQDSEARSLLPGHRTSFTIAATQQGADLAKYAPVLVFEYENQAESRLQIAIAGSK